MYTTIHFNILYTLFQVNFKNTEINFMICEKYATSESYIGSLPVVTVSGVDRFDVSKVFDCGQCFRFDRVILSPHENEFAGCAHGKYVSVAQDGDTIYINKCN